MKTNYLIITHISAKKISSNILLICFEYYYITFQHPPPPDNDTEPLCPWYRRTLPYLSFDDAQCSACMYNNNLHWSAYLTIDIQNEIDCLLL